MDNKKRPRLEVSQNMLNTATKLKTSLPMATIGGQSFFLSSASDCVGSSNNNVLLTICAENSNESTEYFSLEESLAHIKQEDEMDGLQYRLVSPLRTTLDGVAQANNASSVLPATVQLPSGCDIYLVKEYVEEESVPLNDTAGIKGNIKLDSNVCSTSKLLSSHNGSTLMPKPINHTAAGTADFVSEANNKRSFILETYKKRDDKRRATHNEVERRRRDKINNWIFKLKEMLPDMPNVSHTSNSNRTSIATVATTASERSNSRTPPSDSKSQILIKACEYIRTMQEELKSLRECLSENESLRSSNQRLQGELDRLKKNNSQHQDFSSRFINSNNNNNTNITLNTLNSAGNLFGISTSGAAASYTKRELIIRDYVD